MTSRVDSCSRHRFATEELVRLIRQVQEITRRHESHIYALMRIVTGFLFLWHGMQKHFGIPTGAPPGVPGT